MPREGSPNNTHMFRQEGKLGEVKVQEVCGGRGGRGGSCCSVGLFFSLFLTVYAMKEYVCRCSAWRVQRHRKACVQEGMCLSLQSQNNRVLSENPKLRFLGKHVEGLLSVILS